MGVLGKWGGSHIYALYFLNESATLLMHPRSEQFVSMGVLGEWGGKHVYALYSLNEVASLIYARSKSSR